MGISDTNTNDGDERRDSSKAPSSSTSPSPRRSIEGKDPEADNKEGIEEGHGPLQLEEKRKPKNCTRDDIGLFICISPLLVGALILFGFTVYKIVVSALEVFEHNES